jgi:hypothetical protein
MDLKPLAPGQKVTVYKMYYSFCPNPGCGAINDYADTIGEARKNAKAHERAHNAGRTERPAVTGPTSQDE